MKKRLLTLAALAALAGCASDLNFRVPEHRFSYDNTVISQTVTTDKEDNKYETQGNGVILKDKYVTLNHVTSQDSITYRTPFGALQVPIDKKNETTSLDGNTLEKIVSESDSDVAVFKLDSASCVKYCNKGFELNTELKVGDKVYFVANPQLSGKQIRHARVSRLDSPFNEQKDKHKSFGIDTYCVSGDSGGPVFDKKHRIVGLVQAVHSGMCYIKPISAFKEYLK